MPDKSIDNNRIESRIIPSEVLIVRDETTEQDVGHILDYSVNGFMLSTSLTFIDHAEYRLSFNIKRGDEIQKILSFRSTCRWKRLDPSTGKTLAGFKIMHRGEDKIKLIKAIIEQYSTTS